MTAAVETPTAPAAPATNVSAQDTIRGDNNAPKIDLAVLHKLSKFNREKIPERIVHAKGSGGYGEFEVCR